MNGYSITGHASKLAVSLMHESADAALQECLLFLQSLNTDLPVIPKPTGATLFIMV